MDLATSPEETAPEDAAAPADVGRVLRLDRPDRQFAVGAGRALLFAVQEGEAARRQIGAVEAGGLLFGAEPSLLGGETLVAVLDRPADVHALPTGLWDRPEAAASLAAGTAHWLHVLANGIGSAFPSPPGGHAAAREGTVHLGAGAVLPAGAETVWLRLPAGGALLFGIEPVSGLVPLPPGAFVILEDGGEVEVLPFADGWELADRQAGLAGFNQAVAELLPVARGFAETDEHHRLTLKSLAHERDRGAIVERLGGLLRRRRRRRGAGDEALPAVLRHFESEGGFQVRIPPRSKRALMDVPPTLEEICRASDIRLQRVSLRRGWWREEGGPFLARRLDATPVALVWRHGAFRETDAEGRTRRLGAADAARIEPAAHIPFAALPARNDAASLLKRSLRAEPRDVLGFLASVAVGAAIAQLAPITTGFIFGTLVPAAMDGAIVQLAAVVCAIGVVGFAVAVAGARARLAMDAREDERLYREVWDKLLALPLARFRAASAVELNGQAAGAVSYMSGVRQFASMAARAVGFGVGSLWVIAAGDGRAMAVALLAALVHLAVTYGLSRLQVQAILNGEALRGSSESQMLQIVGGLPTLRGAGAEARALSNWAHRFVGMRARLVRSRRVANLFEAWAVAFPVLASCALFAVLAAGGGADGRPVAVSMTIIVSFGILMGATGQFARALARFVSQGPTWNLARPLLDHPVSGSAELVDPGPISGEFEFSAVAFAYPGGQPVLRGVSFHVRPGEFVAVVGPSGGGKSTLLRLLLGLEQPGGGAVYLDGHDIASLDPAAMRRRMAVVTQNERLPPGTLLEIVRGQGDAGPDEVWAALEKAAVAGEVAAMPMGLHTLLQDAARTLSGGQVQRIALARAFLATPRLLLLDEATSALDAATQDRVLEAVIASRATRFVIAHRLSTVRRADRILVLDEGRIAEQGTYGELVTRGSLFADLAGAGGR